MIELKVAIIIKLSFTVYARKHNAPVQIAYYAMSVMSVCLSEGPSHAGIE